jgi:magnesium transporter
MFLSIWYYCEEAVQTGKEVQDQSLQGDDLWLAPVMAVAMFLSMIMAGLSGVLIPLGLKLLRIDPALASTVIITTITDVLGFFLLLGAAALAIQYLL